MPPMKRNIHYLGITETAARCGITRQRVAVLARDGRIPGVIRQPLSPTRCVVMIPADATRPKPLTPWTKAG